MYMLYRPEDGAMVFYMRRARRLLTIYHLTIVATLVAAYFLTIPPDFGQVAEQAVWASAFSSNIGFWNQNSYFDKMVFDPLLHLWSLWVEIQFYIVFPLILRACRFHRSLLPVFVVISLILCFVITSVSPKTSFFMLPSRFWESGWPC